jgi:hypothetical protein
MNDWLLYLHLIFLALAVVGIVLADRSGLHWMRGKKEVVDKKDLFTAHWVVTVGLLGLVYTGFFLFWPMRQYLLGQPYFLLKMLLVGMLLLNAMVIDWLMHVASVRSFASLSNAQKTPLLVSGAISGLGWVCITVLAYLQFGWPF